MIYPPCPPGIPEEIFRQMCHHDFNGSMGSSFNFQCLENIPDYCEFPVPEELIFVRPHGTGGNAVIELSLQTVLDTMDDDERYNLTPGRWARIKREMASGECIYPRVAIYGGRPLLEDGRHRLVYMIRILKRKTGLFLVPHDDLPAILAWASDQQNHIACNVNLH